MKRELMAMLALLAILTGGWLVWRVQFGTPNQPSLIVIEVKGGVQLQGNSGGREATTGATLLPQERVVTGADGRAVLGFGDPQDPSRVTLAENGSVEVLSVNDKGVRLALEGGKVEATIKAGSLGIQAGNREVTAVNADFRMVRDRGGSVAIESMRGDIQVASGTEQVRLGAGERVVATAEAPLVGTISDSLLLTIESPPGSRTREPEIPLEGQTEPGAMVRVLGPSWSRDTIAGTEGRFRVIAPLALGENHIQVEVTGILGDTRSTELTVSRTAGTIGVQIVPVP